MICDNAIVISHQGIRSEEFIGKKKRGHMNIAIYDYEITSEDFHRETNRGSAKTATAISNCYIVSEGVKMHRRRVNWIRGRLIGSKEG